MSGPALSFANWFGAALPLALILALMVRFRWGGARAGPAGAVAAPIRRGPLLAPLVGLLGCFITGYTILSM